jgi:hypothetical protein
MVRTLGTGQQDENIGHRSKGQDNGTRQKDRLVGKGPHNKEEENKTGNENK